MEKSNIEQKLADILPNREYAPGFNNPNKEAILNEASNNIKQSQAAKELAKLKYKEKQRLRSLEASDHQRQALAKEIGMDPDSLPQELSPAKAEKIKAQQQRIKDVEALEAQVVNSDPSSSKALDVGELAKVTPASEYPQMVKKALQLQGASRPEIVKLLNSLNINLSVRLSKTDTANLLACILTCNESQLQALMSNVKVPIAIKAVIKRLLEDAKLGNIEVIERLWTRIFGKEPLNKTDDVQGPTEQSIIPNIPISREAYVIIRDTLIK